MRGRAGGLPEVTRIIGDYINITSKSCGGTCKPAFIMPHVCTTVHSDPLLAHPDIYWPVQLARKPPIFLVFLKGFDDDTLP